VNGLRYSMQPAPYPERYALNQQAFVAGDPSAVAELKRRYKVRWLLADTRAAGGVSPRLAQVATVRFVSGPVTVYEVR
jgi:hypothetical protein